MELDRIIQHCLHELDGPAWIAKRVEVMPGVVDSEIIHITPEMDRLYGYVWPDTLVGRRISEIHTLTDAQITRQYALLRHLGCEAPQHYVMHGLHPNGRIFRIIKHVNQQAMGPITLWVTRHEKWYPSTPLSLLKPLGHSKIKVEHVQGKAEKPSLLTPPPEIERLPAMVCQKCQHTWTPRKPQRPEVCPRCKNPRWWEPRQRMRKKRSEGPGTRPL